MDSIEWEVFKRTGNIEHYLLLKEREREGKGSLNYTENI